MDRNTSSPPLHSRANQTIKALRNQDARTLHANRTYCQKFVMLNVKTGHLSVKDSIANLKQVTMVSLDDKLTQNGS